MILGYGHPAVEAAVAEQLAAGDCLSLPGPRMVELAERLVALTPRADFAVFGKNGADATSWAVDVARAHTGRPRIARVRGAYHAARPWALPHLPGVPAHHRDELLEFDWNDLDGLGALFTAHPREIAVVITTPFDHATGSAPAPGFFAGLRALCDGHGAVLAMDDVRAGFRFHLGGSCERFGAEPDVICYSKAIANGHALSAALAREPLRRAAERVYFTGSFFFASGAFAAALATVRVLEETDAIARIHRIGSLLVDGLQEQARRHGVPVLPCGQPAMPVIRLADDPERRRIRRWCEIATEGGAYAHPAHNWFVSAAHTADDVARTLEATERAFRTVAAEAG
jgi:glutamate-1-semialdehyde 2,1-aminomutase